MPRLFPSAVCVWSVPYNWRRAPCAGRTSRRASDSSRTSPDTPLARGTTPGRLAKPADAASCCRPVGGTLPSKVFGSPGVTRLQGSDGDREGEMTGGAGSQPESSLQLHLPLACARKKRLQEAGPRIFSISANGVLAGEEEFHPVTAKSHRLQSFHGVLLTIGKLSPVRTLADAPGAKRRRSGRSVRHHQAVPSVPMQMSSLVKNG